MTIDISSLSIPELLELQKNLVLEVPRRMALEKQKVVADLKKLAADRGFDLNELLGSKVKETDKRSGPRGPAPVKYRSPEGQEWSGRGRKPAWVVSHIDAGGKIEDLAV